MVSLFNGGKSDSLASLRYSFLAKKVATAKTFVTPERLPPTTSATNIYSRRSYLQAMEWVGKNDGMQPTEWGWAVQVDTLVPLMMKDSPAPNKMVHCNCSAGCSSMRYGCRKHALECTRACGNCQDGDCDNVSIRQYHMMTKTKSSKMQETGSDRRTSVSIDKLRVMFKCSLPVTPEFFLS